MKKNCGRALAALLMVMADQQVKPISEEMAVVGAAGAGIAVGALAGGGWHLGNNLLNKAYVDKYQRMVTTAGIGVACGFTAALLTYSSLSETTPQGRLNHVKRLLARIEQSTFIARIFVDEDDFLNYVRTNSGVSSWPLITARNALQEFSITLRLADDILTLADQEATGASMKNRLVECKDRVFALLITIEDRVALIMKQPEYRDELACYDRHQERERR